MQCNVLEFFVTSHISEFGLKLDALAVHVVHGASNYGAHRLCAVIIYAKQKHRRQVVIWQRGGSR